MKPATYEEFMARKKIRKQSELEGVHADRSHDPVRVGLRLSCQYGVERRAGDDALHVKESGGFEQSAVLV